MEWTYLSSIGSIWSSVNTVVPINTLQDIWTCVFFAVEFPWFWHEIFIQHTSVHFIPTTNRKIGGRGTELFRVCFDTHSPSLLRAIFEMLRNMNDWAYLQFYRIRLGQILIFSWRHFCRHIATAGCRYTHTPPTLITQHTTPSFSQTTRPKCK